MAGAANEYNVGVEHTSPLNAIQAAAAVVAFRREIPGGMQRWTLGGLGSFEIDSKFSGLTLMAQKTAGEQRIVTTGRLWSADGMAVVGVEIAIYSALAPPTSISLTPTGALPPCFIDSVESYTALANAALTELHEELQYHAAAVRRKHNPVE